MLFIALVATFASTQVCDNTKQLYQDFACCVGE